MLYLLLINFTHFACINSFYHHNNSKKQVLLVSIYILWNERTQSCLTLCDPMDCSPPGSSLYGILQARILEWIAISSCRGSSQPRDWTQVSHIAGRLFPNWTTRQATYILYYYTINPYKNCAEWVLSLFNRQESKVKHGQNLNNLWKDMQQAAEVKFA